MNKKKSKRSTEKLLPLLSEETKGKNEEECENEEQVETTQRQTELLKEQDETPMEAFLCPTVSCWGDVPIPLSNENPLPYTFSLSTSFGSQLEPSSITEVNSTYEKQSPGEQWQRGQYHIWQNLETGEYEYRPVKASRRSNAPQQSLRFPQGELPSQLNFNSHPGGLKSSSLSSSSLQSSQFSPTTGKQVKKSRARWTGELKTAFENVFNELGHTATPNPIRDILHKRGFKNITREQISSHLQKHKLKMQQHSTLKQDFKNSSKLRSDTREKKDSSESQDFPKKTEEEVPFDSSFYLTILLPCRQIKCHTKQPVGCKGHLFQP